jgi:putative transposase
MSDVVLLSRAQMTRSAPYFPRSRGKRWMDDRLVANGIIYVIRNGLMWKDVPRGYGAHKTLYNRFVRRSRMGVASSSASSRFWPPASHARGAPVRAI